MAAGFASERLIRAAPQVMARVPLMVTTPFGCRPESAPPASNSSVPEAEGESVRSPARFRFPVKAVARSVPGRRDTSVPKGSTLLSFSRSHGLFAAAENWESSSLFVSQASSSGVAPPAEEPGSVASVRTVRSPPRAVTFTVLSAA